MAEIRNRVVLITGASSGIGMETAVAFARNGAHTVLAARRKDRIDEILGRLDGGRERHLSLQADIADKESVAGLVGTVLERFGRIDILVNNAGISYIGLVEDLDMDKAVKVIDINILGTIRVTRAVLPHMIAKRGGRIITVSSFLGRRGAAFRSMYAASKFGVEGFMESLRPEVRRYGIRVSMIRPSTVMTGFSEKMERDTEVCLPVFDARTPEDVAGAIVRIARRPRNGYVVGALSRGTLLLNRMFPSALDRILDIDFARRKGRK